MIITKSVTQQHILFSIFLCFVHIYFLFQFIYIYKALFLSVLAFSKAAFQAEANEDKLWKTQLLYRTEVGDTQKPYQWGEKVILWDNTTQRLKQLEPRVYHSGADPRTGWAKIPGDRTRQSGSASTKGQNKEAARMDTGALPCPVPSLWTASGGGSGLFLSLSSNQICHVTFKNITK